MTAIPVREHTLDLIGNTPLVELPAFSPRSGVRLFAKLEGNNPTGSVKDRIARAMVQAALDDGTLDADRMILEPTSGNTGISLAMVTSRLGFRFTAVMPDNSFKEDFKLSDLRGKKVFMFFYPLDFTFV